MTTIWPAIAILAFVTAQRLIELPIARANGRRLRRFGGYEVARGHYPLLVAVHVAWLASLWWLAPSRPVHLQFLALFVVVEFGRLWVLHTLGSRWTTRIIVVPGERLVARGPYKYVDHPNYMVVIAEIAVLPMIFGLWQVALIFSAANAAVLAIRIRAENRALERLRR